MPITLDKKLPAVDILRSENIFVMDDVRATHQDIRPMNVLILNLMPTKVATETQLLRLLANTPLQINVDFSTWRAMNPRIQRLSIWRASTRPLRISRIITMTA